MKAENMEIKSKILIVEDNEVQLNLVDFILQKNNYHTFAVTNGTEALEILNNLNPDLILLDIGLPDFSGIEICKKIKNIDRLKDVPVIFFTGRSDVKDIVKGFEAGGVDYVTKPFNEDELLVRIQNHLELVKSKRKIELQANQLLLANAMKDKMFSLISHDLRSPISSVKLTLDFIATGILKPDDVLYMDTIKELSKTTDEAYVLLENLLGWAKSQSNTLKVVPEILTLRSLAESVVGLLKLTSENKKIRIENRISEEISVFADMQMIHSVFRNLLSNALKFTPENGLIVLDGVVKETDVEISVKDSGVGISLDNLEKIFDQKQSVKTFGTNNEAGSGLGLVLCKDFVEKNGGEIQVKSEIGKGSTFIFNLPLRAKN